MIESVSLTDKFVATALLHDNIGRVVVHMIVPLLPSCIKAKCCDAACVWRVNWTPEGK